MFRSVLIALAALAGFAAAPASAETAAPARCEEMNFRIYFQPGSASLSEDAMHMLDVASRNVAGCSYAELHVAVDAASPYAAERGQAIMAAANDRSWNVAGVEGMGMTRMAAYGGPEFAEVTMTPRVMPASAPLTMQNRAGV